MKKLFFLFLLLPLGVLAQSSSTEEEPTPPYTESGSSWTWIIPTVLALGAGGYAWFVGEAAKRRMKQLEGYIKQVSKAQKKSSGAQATPQTVAAPVMRDDRAVQALDKRIGSLEKELEELRAELKRKTRAPQQAVQSPSPSPTQPAARPQPAPKPQPTPAQPMPSVMETVSKVAPPVAPVGAQTRWAKYADAGDGFNAAALSDMQDSEKLFELSVEGMNGSFRVVSTRAAQQMALHDPTFYLAKACTYDTLPSPQSTITTESPGTLRLVGGKWVIQQPAKIRFS